MVGLGKGILGILVRPAVGLLELVSKGTYGMGLICLGREAISGSNQRRVRAPGALLDELPEVIDFPPSSLLLVHQSSPTTNATPQAGEESHAPELEAQQRNIIAAWQTSVHHLFPSSMRVCRLCF